MERKPEINNRGGYRGQSGGYRGQNGGNRGQNSGNRGQNGGNRGRGNFRGRGRGGFNQHNEPVATKGPYHGEMLIEIFDDNSQGVADPNTFKVFKDIMKSRSGPKDGLEIPYTGIDRQPHL